MGMSGFRDEWVTNWDTLRFQWWESEQSIAYNYTTIGWKLELISTSYGAMQSSAAKSWWVNVNGSYYEGTNNVSINNNTTKELASGYTTIYHNSDGTKEFSYSFSQYFGITFSGNRINSVSGSSTGTLTSIPRKATFKSNGVSDFDDETAPTIYFNHPAGSALELQARIMCGDTAITSWRIIDGTKDSYTFPLDQIQSYIWTETIKNKSTYVNVTFELATWMGNSFEYDISPVKRCTVINCEPELNPTVKDMGDGSYKLTADRNTIIKYFNYPIVEFNATSKKNATIVSKTVVCGSKSATAIGNDIHLENVDSNVFKLIVVDDRGNRVEREITKPSFIEYTPLTCRVDVEKDLQSDNTANIKLHINGTYYDGFFDSAKTVRNDFYIEYRYKGKNDADYGSWERITRDDNDTSIADGNYSAEATITISDYRDIYTIQVRASDSIFFDAGGIYTKDIIIKIIPAFDWGENDFNFNVPVFKEGNPMGYYPIGGIFTSTENINPGELFGGTWQLMRTFYGGELVAHGSAWNDKASSLVASKEQSYGFSDILGGGVYASNITNYIPDIFTPSSGTIWVQTKGIVGLVEAYIEISGMINSGCIGIWFHDENKNTLPSSVILTGGQGLMAVNGSYSGAATTYMYNVSNLDTGTDFFVNPLWSTYGGSMNPGVAGTKSTLHVKAFAKGGTTYMWKRIA